MFMGVGNLICMPLALAVGRRAIYLASLVVMILGGLLAAYSTDYNWHLGARMVLGLAAGNSEALVPMMIQEIHFIHERSTFLTWQMAIQCAINTVSTRTKETCGKYADLSGLLPLRQPYRKLSANIPIQDIPYVELRYNSTKC